MLDKPSLNSVCVFCSTAFDLRIDNTLYRIRECKLRLGDELKDGKTNCSTLRGQAQGGPALFQSPGNRLCFNSHLGLLSSVSVELHTVFSFHSLERLPFPSKPKLAITLTSLLGKEQKGMIICLSLREFSLMFSSENRIPRGSQRDRWSCDRVNAWSRKLKERKTKAWDTPRPTISLEVKSQISKISWYVTKSHIMFHNQFNNICLVTAYTGAIIQHVPPVTELTPVLCWALFQGGQFASTRRADLDCIAAWTRPRSSSPT